MTICEGCCAAFQETTQYRTYCSDCEKEAEKEHAEQESENRIENALSCKCGAWGFGENGNVYHAADCVCGNT